MKIPRAKAVLAIVCLAELLAMSLWFSGTVVAPFLAGNWADPVSAISWLTLAVQLGFVAGALLIAVLNLNDRFSAPRVIAFSAWLGAIANYTSFVHHESPTFTLILRFVVGAVLAGVYPSGMKLLSNWFQQGRGFALGTLVGSLAVGSALPHLLAAIGVVTGRNWHLVMQMSSVQALVGGALIFFFVSDGPFAAASPPFDVRQVGEVLRDRRLRLATFGYLGHMWELYSLWTWIAVILAAASATDPHNASTRFMTFVAMSAGLIGCIWAGIAADRAERTRLVRSRSRVTIIAMTVSGACCLATAALLSFPKAVMAIALVWGISVIADSAQFSAVVSEIADRRYIGTALTTQTALGFLLTVIGIRATGYIAQHHGWRIAVATLALGPALGTFAMWRLSRLAPDSSDV